MTDHTPQLHRYALGHGTVAFSTTRHGGHGTGRYASFNINPYCGDADEAIAANRHDLCRLLDIDESHLVMPHQIHGIESRIIGSEFLSLPAAVRTMILDGVDAVMTQQTGLCIGVSTADCIPLLIHDESHHAVCAVHAGWRGTVASIALKAVHDMRAAFGSQPADLHVVIGPGISRECFEVGDEVYEAFTQAGFNMEAISERRDKWHIDLPLCNKLTLEAAGVPSDHITMSGICTYTSSDDFFSARHDGAESGRIYNGIMLTQ